MTDLSPPVLLRYEGEGEFRPATPYIAKRCDQEFVVGELTPMQRWEERSTATHNHEFAWLKEAWLNLPENLADQYPTAEHLRKRGLIQAGYYDEMTVDAGSNAAALRVAAAMQAIDTFAMVFVRGPFVIRRTAKSQSRRAMDKQAFQESKSKLMEVVAELIGVDPATLQARGEAA